MPSATAFSWLERPLANAPIAFINHVLRSQPWALQKLRPFVGKSILFQAPLFKLRLVIQANGEFESAVSDAAIDATIAVTPPVLARILAGDRSAYTLVDAQGETALVSEIAYLASRVRWDVEEDLGRVFGDILAHRMVQAGAGLLAWRKEASLHLARNFAEYWTEEQPLLAKPREVHAFIRMVDVLRDDAERLEKRLDRLTTAK